MNVKDVRAQLIEASDAERVLFIDAKPKFTDPAHVDVTHVGYIVGIKTVGAVAVPQVEVWMRTEAEGWEVYGVDVKVDRGMALAHYDALQWKLFRKDDRAKRKMADGGVDREQLRRAVRYFYDLQKLRIQSGNRDTEQAEPAVLEDDDKDFFGRQSLGLEALEKSTLAEIDWMLSKVPIYAWLKAQKGCGPTLAGVIVAEIDITRCDTPSALWAYAGLAVDNATGRAVRRKKGHKSNWNPFLKAKMVFVLGGCFLKANSPWREFYDNYKTRKQNQLVDECMLCAGLGALLGTEPADPKKEGTKTCYNCKGKCSGVPWGRGDAHRHQSAIRYMVKMFLLKLWTHWRELEGLPVTEPYAEAKLGRRHGDHTAIRPKQTALRLL